MWLTVEPSAHPSLMQLSPGALHAWYAAVQRCDLLHTDILELAELEDADDRVIEEWEHAGLAARLPLGNLRMLARESLWEVDHLTPHAA
jgi:hypothetical protein